MWLGGERTGMRLCAHRCFEHRRTFWCRRRCMCRRVIGAVMPCDCADRYLSEHGLWICRACREHGEISLSGSGTGRGKTWDIFVQRLPSCLNSTLCNRQRSRQRRSSLASERPPPVYATTCVHQQSRSPWPTAAHRRAMPVNASMCGYTPCLRPTRRRSPWIIRSCPCSSVRRAFASYVVVCYFCRSQN